MSKVLHITNGDSFTQKLLEKDFDGEIVTWREMLGVGSTLPKIGSDVFWRERYAFLKNEYQMSKPFFLNKVLKEYKKLCDYKKADEIVLWFNDTLFDTINMLAIISWVKRYRSGFGVSLATPNNNLDLAFKKRQTISKDDIEYAHYIWQLYCEKDATRLVTFSKFNSSEFTTLPNAIKLHLQRFPSMKNGLNKNENYIIKMIDSENFSDEQQLAEALENKDYLYGFTSQNYKTVLQPLKVLFTMKKGLIALNHLGHQVLEKTENCYKEMFNEKVCLGGGLKYSFIFDAESDNLLKL